jgi:hypothetical protein
MLPWILSGYSTSTPLGTASVTDAKLAAERAVHDVQARLESLELACAGMWELLKRHGYTDAELVDAVRAVDARDGAVDGKMTPVGVEVCPHCQRRLLSRRSVKCSWCGGELGRVPF